MRVFAISDIHIDYPENRKWLSNLSSQYFLNDILILAGDITDKLNLLEKCFQELSEKFLKVIFVPGNHELWVSRDVFSNSLEKYQQITNLAIKYNISMQPYHTKSLSIVPLLGWYDFSFAPPSIRLFEHWMDFHACIWPDNFEQSDITKYFLEKNNTHLKTKNKTVISFSHFLPRIDLMPDYIPQSYRYLYPALGSILLEKQIRILMPKIHVYGHSHVNQQVILEGIHYINNAFGNPAESRFTKKTLLCVYEH